MGLNGNKSLVILLSFLFWNLAFAYGAIAQALPTISPGDSIGIGEILLAKYPQFTSIKNVPRWVRRMERFNKGCLNERMRAITNPSKDWEGVKWGYYTRLFVCGYGTKQNGVYLHVDIGGMRWLNFYFEEKKRIIRMSYVTKPVAPDFHSLTCPSLDAIAEEFDQAGRRIFFILDR